MKNSLITSEAALADCQAKIDHIFNVLLRPAFNKLNFSAKQWQVVVENGGQLQDQAVELVKKLVKKASGIITPVRAQDTGLIPNGWTVKSDSLEGDINLANLDYSSCPVREGETYVSGDTMLQRAIEAKAYGSLGFAAALIKEQEEGKEIFPVESRDKHYFIMPLTVLIGVGRGREVACFDWDGERWVLSFRWLDDYFLDGDRFVRPRE
ncbi:MAG: hypothetical protein Q8O93_02395 [bacterium]|nr:hypothetical protein [bacterium]